MESVRLILYLDRVFNLCEQMIVKYLAFHMELQKRGMAIQFEVARHKFFSFPIIRSVPIVKLLLWYRKLCCSSYA